MMKKVMGAASLILVLLLGATAEAAILRVGPGKPYAKPCAAIAAASPGDTIEIDTSVTYLGDVCGWSTSGLTLRGVGGGRAHIDANGKNYGGKGIWVIAGTNTTVENIEFSGATVVDQNGAGIRQEGDNLTVRNCYFHDNDEGILADGSANGTILIEFSEFARNGFGDGQSHNLYINHVGKFIFRYNYSHQAKIGHLLKSRATENYILYNRLTDETTGTASYEINLPNGGLSYVIGNLIEQGPNTDNSAMISYLEEGPTAANPSSALFVVNNTLVNDYTSGTFVYVASGAVPAVIKNNIFAGPGSLTNQATAVKANNFLGDAKLADPTNYDYHLLTGSPAINAGADPGSGSGYSLLPVFQYVHPACAEGRTSVGTIDIGAYEFGGGTGVPPTGGTCGTSTAPVIALSATSLAFGNQTVNTTSGPKTFTISNNGNAPLTISSIVSSGDFAQTNNCSTVAAGASCTVTVTFTPTAIGTRSGSVVITHNAAGSPSSASLSGTGTASVPADFSVSVSPNSNTINAGQSASYTVTVSASGGFSQAVSLSCAGAPTAATCTVAPASVNPNGSTATATLTVTSTVRTGGMLAPGTGSPPALWIFALSAALAMLLTTKTARRRLRCAGAGAILLLVIGVGCGAQTSSSPPPPPPGGTPPGTYTLTVTGAAGSTSHSATASLVVS